MERHQIIARLKEHELDLRARGVARAAVFGSRARGDHRPDSDTDIMIELDPNVLIGVYQLVGISRYIQGFFDGPVDVVDVKAMKPALTQSARADAVYAF